ncbi:uncharacterized protein C12orf29 homolog [Mytilus californianus]|uniref:uncharacterized protein C12orf29 homolog n=1 Tax=Mytilus californianus TaxID=6549 RepID=UPI002244FCA9|nr:uncharacterized protein C12orf29 homolog [Mytilus californianus]
MEGLGSVQQKISCVFKTAVLEEQSNKRSYQPYKVVAVDEIRPQAIEDNIRVARATEKLDGTCVYIAEFCGKPWLWARLDRKPNKKSDKNFKKFHNQKQQWIRDGKQGKEPTFQWNVLTDFKEVPENWIPSSGVPLIDGLPQPDENGHIPGWVPVEQKLKQYVWHMSSVDLDHGLGLVLREDSERPSDLVVEVKELCDLLGHTAELIGTNVNANPYGIGNKKNPLHMLVIHGSIAVKNPPILKLDGVKDWFESSDTNNGRVEGVVWHCPSGVLYKIHRHHLNLSWPIKEPQLSCRKIYFCVDVSKYELSDDKKSIFTDLAKLQGQSCDSLMNIHELCIEENETR